MQYCNTEFALSNSCVIVKEIEFISRDKKRPQPMLLCPVHLTAKRIRRYT